jgi:hypothetical protein
MLPSIDTLTVDTGFRHFSQFPYCRNSMKSGHNNDVLYIRSPACFFQNLLTVPLGFLTESYLFLVHACPHFTLRSTINLQIFSEHMNSYSL